MRKSGFVCITGEQPGIVSKDMKYLKYCVLLLGCLFLQACSPEEDDSGKDVEERPETLAWIEDTMRSRYYWNKQIPDAGQLDYAAGPESFFGSLLYAGEDGKTINGTHYFFSYIEKTSGKTYSFLQEDYSYGFEFTTVRFVQGDGSSYYGALVLYVIPGTPADRAGLKRGDWIVRLNNQTMTVDDAESLYGDVGKTLGISQWNSVRGFVFDRNLEIDDAEPIEDNPVFFRDTYSVGGKKVGYLVYNEFKPGKTNADNTYDNELRTLSAQTFDGVDEFVLDLRYNNGGYLSCMQLLCAILGPNRVLSERQFGYLEYNDGSTDYFTVSPLSGNTQNLNLSRLYVLVSATSASASEAIINLLTPFMNEVVVIGRTTQGKNVGSESFESPDKVWEMHPITFKIFNHNGQSDYANGWIPDIMIGDVFDYNSQGSITPLEKIYELGDPNERMLNTALSLIAGTTNRENLLRTAPLDASVTRQSETIRLSEAIQPSETTQLSEVVYPSAVILEQGPYSLSRKAPGKLIKDN